MIKLTDKVSSLIQMVQNIKENGLMTCNMDREKKAGIMARQGLLEPSIKVKRMEKADLSGKMEVSMKGILLMVISKVMVI